MQFPSVNATARAGTGKTTTRKLRAAGRIPAVCYGKGEEPISLSLDPTELTKSLDPDRRANTVLALKVDDNGKSSEIKVMLRDWQRDPLRGTLVHADFIRVYMDRDVHATVPLVIIGKAKGVALGGTLHQVFRSLEVACTPDKIPSKIEVNVENLGMGDALHVSQLPLAAGVRPLIDANQTICTVTAPKAEKAATEEVAAEGVAAEAAPAAGKDAKAAPAAAGKDAKAAPAKAEAKPGAKK